jgi:carbamate kinase
MVATRKTVVVALGGNALGPPGENVTIYDQFRHTRESLQSVVALAKEGWRIAIVHGNGPQVGDELLRNEMAAETLPELPLGVLVASTAGWIGYMIQQTLQNGLRKAGVDRLVVTQITQVVVDPEAPEMKDPTKFIGRGLSESAAEKLRAGSWLVRRDANGVPRRVVASPKPLETIEWNTIRRLVYRGVIVIAVGGGGVPIYRDPELGLEGVDVVVDKDLAAAVLGCEIGASTLLILTDVDGVYRDFGTERATPLRRLSLRDAEAMLRTDQLGRGSMRPKVEASVNFLRGGGRKALIARLDQGLAAMRGETGTEIRTR